MDLGAPELQVFVSLLVILGAAFVALVCDYLKGHNEQLRERNIELRTRLDEREQIVRAETSTEDDPGSWLDALAGRATGESGSPRSSEPFVSTRPALAAPLSKRVNFDRSLSSWKSSSPAPDWPKVTETSSTAPPPATRSILPLEEIERRVSHMDSPAETTAAPEPPPSTPPKSRFRSLLSREQQELPVPPEPQGSRENGEDITKLGGAIIAAGKEPPVTLETVPDPVAVSDSLAHVLDETTEALPSETLLLEAVVEAEEGSTEETPDEEVTPETVFPRGLIGADIWSGVLGDERPFNGVVFCVGLSDYSRILEAHGQPAVDQVTKSLLTLFESIVTESGLATQASQDTFVLIFRDERGAIGQRRINGLSERLWDYQLRNLGSTSIFFSWGAVEVEAETVRVAYFAAVERMNQSRRSRRGAAVDTSTKR